MAGIRYFWLKFTVIALAAVLLLSCQSEKTHYYQLIKEDSVAAKYNAKTPVILIAPVTLADYLADRPNLVSRKSATEIEYLSFHRWAGELNRSIGAVLQRQLQATLPKYQVVLLGSAKPMPPAASIETVITVKIEKFDFLLSEGSILVAQYNIKLLNDTLKTREVFFVTHSPTRHMADMVYSMNSNLEQLAASIAQDLPA